jgi:hypothetical protein
MKKERLAESPPEKWTRANDYVAAMARKRAARPARKARSEPEAPRALLSTLPFLALIALLGILAVLIMIAAFPGGQPPPKPEQVAAHEKGVAPKGWFQKAQKEFHR